MAKTPTDKQIIGELGISALMDLGYSEDAIKKWRKRGIPWSARHKVKKLAVAKRVKIPADFAEERRAA